MRQEIADEFAGRYLFSDYGQIRALAAAQPKTAKRFRQMLSGWIQKINPESKIAQAIYSDLERARDLYAQAAKEVGAAKTDTAETRHSLEDAGEEKKRLARRKKLYYNEFNTEAMKWAKRSDTNVGDMRILYARWIDSYNLIVSTKEEEGFIILHSGNSDDMEAQKEYYDKRNSISDRWAERARAGQSNNDWDNQYIEDTKKYNGDAGVASGETRELGDSDGTGNTWEGSGDSPGEIRRSLDDIDETYLPAVEAGDMKTASRLVAEAAKRAGYDSPLLYHGTKSFGFTEFDLSKMDDKRSIFLTDKPEVAQTYSGADGVRGRSI